MGTEELSPRGKAALGAACVACCAVPMLLLAGVVSVGAFVAGGFALGSVGVVVLSMLAVHRRWIGSTSPLLRGVIGALGVLIAAIGFAVFGDAPGAGRSLLSVGVAALACAGMLALGDRKGGGQPVSAPPN